MAEEREFPAYIELVAEPVKAMQPKLFKDPVEQIIYNIAKAAYGENVDKPIGYMYQSPYEWISATNVKNGNPVTEYLKIYEQAETNNYLAGKAEKFLFDIASKVNAVDRFMDRHDIERPVRQEGWDEVIPSPALIDMVHSVMADTIARAEIDLTKLNPPARNLF